MGNLVEHAKTELALLRSGEPDEMQDMIERDILQIVEIFERQEHSGSSGSYALGILKQVLDFEPITPLTGADDEWNEVGEGRWQNRRCSHVFKDASGAYDIRGRIFREPDGACFTSRDSRVAVAFPYRPKSEYVDVPE